MFKCVKEQNGLSALLFPSKGRQESGEEFSPLICLSTPLCIFLTRLASLENNPVANQANIFLFAAAPTCMGWQGASPTAACPVPAVGSGCGRLRYLCPAGQVPPADSWHALTHALTEKMIKEAVTTFFLCVSQVFSSRWCSLVKTIPRKAESIHFSKIIWRWIPLASWEITQVGRHGQRMTKGRFMTRVNISVTFTS